MVKVMYGDRLAYMDGYLRDNLELYKKMVKNSRDLVYVVTGREREGKSVLANTILKYLDPTYNISRCCFSGEEFLRAIKKAKNFQAICYDEAQEFTSRGSLTKFNRLLIQALSMIGMKQLYIGICIPSFFELDKYPAIHRSSFLLRTYSHKGQRGYFEFWNWEKKKKLYLFGKKAYNYFAEAPNFRGKFTKDAFPFGGEYDKKKGEAIEDMNISLKDHNTRAVLQRNVLIRYLHNEGLTYKQIINIIKESGIGLSETNMSHIVRNL